MARTGGYFDDETKFLAIYHDSRISLVTYQELVGTEILNIKKQENQMVKIYFYRNSFFLAEDKRCSRRSSFKL